MKKIILLSTICKTAEQTKDEQIGGVLFILVLAALLLIWLAPKVLRLINIVDKAVRLLYLNCKIKLMKIQLRKIEMEMKCMITKENNVQ